MNTAPKKYNALLAFFLLAASQLACLTVTRAFSTPEPIILQITNTPQIIYITATPAPTTASAKPADLAEVVAALSDDEIKIGIQQALDLYAQAYTQNDPGLLTKVVDQENKPFRRIVRNRFDAFQQSYFAGQIVFKNKLLGIERRELGFVIAHFQDEDGWLADWPFRYTGAGWVLTEPTIEQIGEPVISETDYFSFETYPWNAAVNTQIMEMMETARQQVKQKLGQAPQEKARVRIVPIYGLDPYGAMQAIAWYGKGGAPDGSDLIHIYSPQSFAYSYYDPELGWDGTLQRTLTHEYTHMAHARNFDNAGRLADWMSEGLAEYVAGDQTNLIAACYAFSAGANIPILDESEAIRKQDLMHMTNLDANTGLAYAYSHALVEFTAQNYGGLDGFWKLAKNIDETGDLQKALLLSFKVDYATFNQQWQTWLRKQCW